MQPKSFNTAISITHILFMKKLLLGLITFFSISSAFSQAGSLNLIQQIAYYYTNSTTLDGATFNNNSGVDIMMNTATSPTSSSVAWRKFRTAGDNGGVLRSMQIGDRFTITLNASQASGEIGVGLLASPSSTASFADRNNNYAVSVNLDGPDITGGSFGKWYVKYSGGVTSSSTFGGGSPGSPQDFKIDFILTAQNRMSVTISNINVPANTITFYDILLNTSNPITDYSIYLSDSDDGNLTAQPVIWKQETSINNTGAINLGQSNSSFSIASPLTNGTHVTTQVNSINSFNKFGTGVIGLTGLSTYTGSTTINAGAIGLGAANALPTGAVGNLIFAGGNINSGPTAGAGFNLGSSGTPAGAIQLTANSAINLGTGVHSLFFANSSGLAWTVGTTLTITGWQGTTTGGGTAGKIFVSNSTSGLTAGQLAQINFSGFGSGSRILASGEVVPRFEAAPTISASTLSFSNLQPTSMTVNFTPGNGTGGRIVIARAGSAPTTGPSNGTNYNASVVYGSGDPIGGGFVVFSSTGASSTTQTFSLTGLTNSTTYYFDIYEYNGTGASTSYGIKYESTQATPAVSSYTTISDGIWDNINASIWDCSCVPPANSPIIINSNITLGIDESASSLTINSGKSLADAGHILSISASIVNNGIHGGTGEIKLLSSTRNVTVAGTGIYQNIESAVTGTNNNMGTTSDVTINGNLIITSNSVRILNHTLTINGTVSGPGTFTGQPTGSLRFGGAAGTINFSTTTVFERSLNNLSLTTSSSSVTLGTDIDLYGAVAFTGTSLLNFNGRHVTLKSLSSSNATIGNLGTSTLAGASNVTAERYIGTSARAYRTMSSGGINTVGTINANWQEGQSNLTISANSNTVPGYGTHISGVGASTNGFDKTQTDQTSLYAYNNTGVAYVAVPNTNVLRLSGLTPYLFYIRGDRSIDLNSTASPLPTSSTTLRTTGTLITGDQTFSGLVGNPAGDATNGGYNMITNPFASYVNWVALYNDIHAAAIASPSTAGDITTSYTYVDANVGRQGGYVDVNTLGVASPNPGHTVSTVIQPGQSFFIQAFAGNGVAVPVPSVTVKESHKVTGPNNSTVFRALGPLQIFRASIFFNDNGARKVADGVAAIYDDQFSLNVDQNDSPDQEFDENISILRKGVKLQIEARPTVAVKDTMVLYISKMQNQDYELELEAENFSQPGMTATLVDNFKGTRIPVSLSAKTIVPFTVVNGVPASKASDRFYVVFNTSNPLPVTLTSLKAFKQNNGAEVEWNVSQEFNMDRYEIERSATTDFSKIGIVKSKGNSSSDVLYSFFDATPNNGVNFYRIKMTDKNGSVTYSNVVKLLFGSGVSTVSVFPNPIRTNTVNLHFENLNKGIYKIRITNNLGQVVYTKDISHPGGSAIEYLKLKNSMTSGIYDLTVGSYQIKLIKQ